MHAKVPDAFSLLASDQEWLGLLEDDMIWMWHQLKASSSTVTRTGNDLYAEPVLTVSCSDDAGIVLKNFITNEPPGARQHISAQPPGAEFDMNPPSTHFGCMGCQLNCRSAAGEAAHVHRKHGIVSSLRILGLMSRMLSLLEALSHQRQNESTS